MASIPDAAIELLARSWHNRSMRWGLPLGTFVATLAISTRYGADSPSWSRLAFAAALSLVAALTWRVTNRLPRTKKDHVGIIVALLAEDAEHDRQVRADFVAQLRRLLESDAATTQFQLLELPGFATSRSMTQAGALATLTEVRAHFIVYGTVRRRQIGGSAAHLLALDGIVRHTEISPDVQREISADFRRALPSKVQFSVDNDAFAFEVTSEWADVAARYIIGLAALASGDPWYAEKLLLGVEQRLRTSARAGPLQTIAQKLPSRFEELYGRWVEALGRAYAITRRIEFAAASEEVAKKLLNRNPNNYGALLQVAICEFVLRRDVAAAKAAILQCRRVRDSTWRYSLAFLLAYEGKTRRAREEYEEAFKGRLQDVTVPVQAEEFMHLVIEEEPDKAHLYFFTGLINYRVKEDLASARRDFEAFLAQTLPEEHADERRLAQRYLEELQTAPIGSPVA